MGARVTNRELFNRCDATANEAADKLTGMGDDHRERGEPLGLDQITQVRNLLREAFCAAQELKTRLKTMKNTENMKQNTKGEL